MHTLKALFAVLAVALAASGATAEPLLIRNSYVVPVSNWQPLIVEKKDLAKHWGTSYVMEAARYQGTPPMITALANGELEIANLAYSTLGIAIDNAGLSDLRVISDEFRDGVPGYFSNQFFVRKDSGIKKIEDLKGKVLATNAIGAGVDIAMKAGLKKHGLIDKRDFTVIEAPFPTMPAMLNEKKADLVTGVMPFALNPLLNEIGFPLYDQTEGMGPTQFVFWTARQSFIDKHRAVLVDYMEDMLRIERWYLDPKNHDEVAKIASKLLKIPPERFGWLFTKKDYYRDPNMMPDLVALQRNVDTVAEMGFIKSTIDVKKYSDLSLIEEAAKRLK
ncbi:MAG TPA: ABC transporter substrate-binding protein [Xanthobacteraceae bacterium]|jgi:NitT/TauT family transport system substrate-binding protein